MIRALTPADAPALATLHARCFAHGWSVETFADYASSAVHWARGFFDHGDLRGALVAQLVAGEAEVLTLMVDPDWRRRGLAMALLQDMRDHGADQWVLDVAADNAAAIALYARFGSVVVRRRKAYYANGVDALVMAGPVSALD